MSRYHKILGVSTNASKTQIKNAYRRLAKLHHPDRSSETDAHQKFIEITTAYEILFDGKLARLRNTVKEPSPQEKYWHIYSPPKDPIKRAEWEKVAKHRAEYYKEKAQRQAQKRYQKFKEENEAFKKSPYYNPLLFGYYCLQVVCTIAVLSLFILPYIGEYIDPQKYRDPPPDGTIYVVLIFITPVVIAFLLALYSVKKNIDPYFRGY